VVPQDQKTALEFFNKAASKGFARAQYELGDCFERGLVGCEKDIKEAEQWYLKAADSGEIDAQICLGHIYATDDKLKDVNKAVEWCEKAFYHGANERVTAAALEIFHPILMHESCDLHKAIEWAYRGCQHHILGPLLIRTDFGSSLTVIKGLCRSTLRQSPIVSPFITIGSEAIDRNFTPILLRRAAVSAFPTGQYLYAQSLPDNHKHKLKYLRLAAESKDATGPKAQWQLGVLFETGRCGLEKNSVLAKEWKDKAIANGFQPPGA
jgi:TPR repeat protein